MRARSIRQLLAALAVALAMAGVAEAKRFKFRLSSSPSTPKVVTPPSAVQRTTPPIAAPAPVARPSAVLPSATARPPVAPSPAFAPPRDSFMSGLSGGIAGYIVGKSIARSFNSPEAWGGLILQLLIFAGLGFLAFKLAMSFAGADARTYAGVPAGRGGVDPDRLTRVVDRRR